MRIISWCPCAGTRRLVPCREFRVVGGGEAILDSDDGSLAEDEGKAVGEVRKPLEDDALHAM